MNEGKDYDLHTHTEMHLEHVPGKCCRNIPRRVKQQRNNDHNALVTSMWKDDGGLAVAIDGTRLVDPASQELHHRAASSNNRLLSESFQLLE